MFFKRKEVIARRRSVISSNAGRKADAPLSPRFARLVRESWWLVVVAAEMIAVSSGLGFLIVDARNAGNRYDLVLAGMGIIGIIGLLLDVGMRSFERAKSLRWGYTEE